MYYKGATGLIVWEGKMGKVRGRNCVLSGPNGSVAIETGQIVPENWGSARVKITIELLDKELLKDDDAN
jgi:hypothetical protein